MSPGALLCFSKFALLGAVVLPALSGTCKIRAPSRSIESEIQAGDPLNQNPDWSLGIIILKYNERHWNLPASPKVMVRGKRNSFG